MFYPPIIKLLTRNTSMNRNFPVPADWRVGLRSSLIYIQGHFLAIHLEFSKLPRNECSLNHGPSPWPIPMASFVPMPQSLRIQVLAASLAAWASLAGALAAQAVAQAALGEGRASQAHRAAHQPGRGELETRRWGRQLQTQQTSTSFGINTWQSCESPEFLQG